MLSSYIEKKKNIKKELNNYIFGLTYGFGITLIFIFRLLYKSSGIYLYIDMVFIIYGIFCILLATINPNFKILTLIRNLNIKIFNFIGDILLKLILFIIYFILVVPVGLLAKNKKIEGETNFVDYENSNDIKLGKYRFLKIFRLFASEYFYLLPLIIILIIISILFIFITSSVFTPLIYTLF